MGVEIISQDGQELVTTYAEFAARAADNSACPDCGSMHWRTTTARWLLHGKTEVYLVCQSCGRGYSVIAEEPKIGQHIKEYYDARWKRLWRE